ncbi:MAG: SDR family NAD(P)-dependent oxidoreductase [Acidimicrobiales bacterium]
MRLDNKVAFITGGESGIGRATARLFTLEGAKVFLIGLQDEHLVSAVEELGNEVSAFQRADVTIEAEVSDAVQAACDRFGGLDIVFSNAGIPGVIRPIPEYPTEVFREVLDVHVVGAFHVLKHCIPRMRDGGSIVINSSVVGVTAGPGISGYATAKHAHVGLMRTAAKECASRSIRVNTIHPGPTDTAFQREIEVAATGLPAEQAARAFEQGIPLHRHAQPEEIARAVLFLASGESTFMTGSTLVVDGGMHG